MKSIPRLCPILLLCAGAAAQHQNEIAPASAESGTALFRKHCRSCHGRDGEGGRAPSLTGRLHAGDADADMIRVISSGIEGTEMSAYAARLGDEKISRVVAYLKSVKREGVPAAGDAARGESIFWGKGGCGGCHAVGRRGNLLGPDLSRIGRQRSAGYLRESLLDPDADIVPGFTGVSVVTGDGRTLRGIERSMNEFSVVLQEFSGKVHSFDRATLKSATRDNGSLMPSYGKALSAAEIDDLLKYLSTLVMAEVKR